MVADWKLCATLRVLTRFHSLPSSPTRIIVVAAVATVAAVSAVAAVATVTATHHEKTTDFSYPKV